MSVIVPVLNEEEHIDACLAGLTAQTYPKEKVEILVVDGGSSDATIRLVQAWSVRDGRVRLLDNPHQTTAWAMNIGIVAATGDIIAAASGHSVSPATHIERTVANLLRTGAWSTGGAAVRSGTTVLQRSIACATSSPVGVGDATHNYRSNAGWVESVFPGTWPRWVFDRIGLFDPAMTFNEDNELSYRIRRAGGKIWFDPDVRVVYVPRASIGGLFQQYRRYARGRVAVLMKHGGGISWRHAVPPMWVAWLVVGPFFALAVGFLPQFAASLLLYVAVVVVGAYRATRGDASVPLVVIAIVVMHLAFGIGIWQGVGDLAARRAQSA